MFQISIKQKKSSLSIKNGEFGDNRCFFCLLHEVLCFKSNYRAQTINLIWIPFLSLRISLWLFLQFYVRRWERSIGLCHRVKNKISQKDAKCIPSRVTAWIVICAGESFGVLRLGTSPQISFSNDNLIKQFTTCRLAISQNIPWLLPLPSPPPPPPPTLGTIKIPRINEKQRSSGWGGGFWGGITWFLGEERGGLVVTENPEGRITENFVRIQRTDHSNLLGKWRQWGGGGTRKSSNVIRGDRLNLTLFSPKSPRAINNYRSLI